MFATVPAQLVGSAGVCILPEAASLNAANKRVANILKRPWKGGEAIATSDAAQEPAEQALRQGRWMR